MTNDIPTIWFPTVRTGTGTDVFTRRLATCLEAQGFQTYITWLPLRAEYAPWTVLTPRPPEGTCIAHVNTWLPASFVPAHMPVVATVHHAVHHPDAHVYKGALRSAYHRGWIAPNERRVLSRAEAVVAVSRFVARTTEQTLLDVPLRVIYNGVDTRYFTPPPARTRQVGEPFRLLYVGSWIARKGVDLLPAIMQGLGQGFELRYTGGPAAEADKARMPPQMIDIGRLQGDAAVVAAMQQADALLLPSRSEGHPLVAIEAMACGLPVVGMEGSSVAEAVSNGETGLLCPREDVTAFVAAIHDLASDPSQHARLARQAREQAVMRFSMQAMVDAYVQLYEALMEPAE